MIFTEKLEGNLPYPQKFSAPICGCYRAYAMKVSGHTSTFGMIMLDMSDFCVTIGLY